MACPHNHKRVTALDKPPKKCVECTFYSQVSEDAEFGDCARLKWGIKATLAQRVAVCMP